MKDAVDAQQVAGTVTLVVRNGQVAYLEAAGALDREAGAAMAPDTIFRIASMTKAVVSVGIMMLVEEGRLSISDPVSKFIPAFAKTTVLGTQNGRVAVVPATRQIRSGPAHTHRRDLVRRRGPRTVVLARRLHAVVLRGPRRTDDGVDRQTRDAALRGAAG
jgi:hypothetical protein